MTRIKLCGLSRPEDIASSNRVQPEFVGFVFVPGSKRYVSTRQAQRLKALLSPRIQAVGVFADAEPETVAGLLDRGVIDLAQLHGGESGDYIRRLRALTGKPIIQAFRITSAQDVMRAETSIADHILLDSGAGTGTAFDWALLRHIKRPYFLAGGLGPGKVERAVELLHPYAVDVSSGIETEGVKDPSKMAAFVAAVRKEDKR